MANENGAERVQVVRVVRQNNRGLEYVVTLDGVVVRREGSANNSDYTYAMGFAAGLRLGLATAVAS